MWLWWTGPSKHLVPMEQVSQKIPPFPQLAFVFPKKQVLSAPQHPAQFVELQVLQTRWAVH
jgi:hypothetical protein